MPRAGWYDDPHGAPDTRRWWDGERWGTQTMSVTPALAPAARTGPATTGPAAAQPAWVAPPAAAHELAAAEPNSPDAGPGRRAHAAERAVWHRRWRRPMLAAAALIVLVVAVAVGVPLLRDTGRGPTARASGPQPRITDAAAGVSYVPPPGWQRVPAPAADSAFGIASSQLVLGQHPCPGGGTCPQAYVVAGVITGAKGTDLAFTAKTFGPDMAKLGGDALTDATQTSGRATKVGGVTAYEADWRIKPQATGPSGGARTIFWADRSDADKVHYFYAAWADGASAARAQLEAIVSSLRPS